MGGGCYTVCSMHETFIEALDEEEDLEDREHTQNTSSNSDAS